MTSLLPTPEPPDPVEGALGHFEHTNWVKAALKALDAGTVHAAAGSAGQLTVDGLVVDKTGAETADITLRGNSAKSLWGNVGANPRWRLVMGDSTAEGGNNSGSSFALFAYDDQGAYKVSLSGTRDTGLLTVLGSPVTAKGVATKEYVDSSVPIGAIIAYGGTVAPVGWHICNGTAHGSSALQAVIGSANTPDLSGRFIVGTGTGYSPKQTGGVETVKLTAAESGLPQHTHLAATQAETTTHTHVVDPPDVTSQGASARHTHSGTTGFQDRMAQHGHGVREGITTGDSDWWVDTADATPGGDIVRDNIVIATNTDHRHAFSTGNDTPDHTHKVISAAFDSGGRSAAHTHGVTVENVTAAAASVAHENRPPYYALVYIIKKA